MKDIFQIFDENFKAISKVLGQGNYQGCSNILTSLTTVAVLANYGDGILIGELFEGALQQVGPVFQRFEFSKEEQDTIKEKLVRTVGAVAKSYQKEDKNELYNALKDFRSVETELQFRAVSLIKSKPEMEGSYRLGVR